MRYTIAAGDDKFDEEAMRYNDGKDSYVVHTGQEQTHFYYRFLTETERDQYYAGTLTDAENVEAVVQFTELPLNETYALRETRVPDGYVQAADFEAEMSDIKLPTYAKDDTEQKNPVYDVLYTVTNHRKMVMPTAGLGGIRGPLTAGLLLIALSGMLLWKANRRRLPKGQKPRP